MVDDMEFPRRQPNKLKKVYHNLPEVDTTAPESWGKTAPPAPAIGSLRDLPLPNSYRCISFSSSLVHLLSDFAEIFWFFYALSLDCRPGKDYTRYYLIL